MEGEFIRLFRYAVTATDVNKALQRALRYNQKPQGSLYSRATRGATRGATTRATQPTPEPAERPLRDTLPPQLEIAPRTETMEKPFREKALAMDLQWVQVRKGFATLDWTRSYPIYWVLQRTPQGPFDSRTIPGTTVTAPACYQLAL
jgi:hypothetical protein